MAANDEFPRGWQVQAAQNASGLVAGFTVAGVPGISHVIEGVQFIWENYQAGSIAIAALAQVLINGAVVWTGIISSPAGFGKDSASFVGPRLVPVGQSIGAQINIAPGAGQFSQVEMQAHDI